MDVRLAHDGVTKQINRRRNEVSPCATRALLPASPRSAHFRNGRNGPTSHKRAMQPSESSEAPRRVLLSRVRPLTALLIVCVAFGVGLATVPAGNRTAVALTSSCLGWAYFTCWSVSFYPQLVLNFERRSVVGLSFDYAAPVLQGWTREAAESSSSSRDVLPHPHSPSQLPSKSATVPLAPVECS